MKEFQLIEHYFKSHRQPRKDVLIGIGDDCALVYPSPEQAIAISCDTLVEGTHFFPNIPAAALGYKSLAVSLSDLASMGAQPAWFTLALTMPKVDSDWLEAYSNGLFEAADYYGIALVGGDTTRGPLAITITVQGLMPKDKALTRSGAKVGDWLYVTGTLGDSALGLDLLRGKQQAATSDYDYLVNRHYKPTPRVLAGHCLRGLASSCIDLSDGLVSDIKHILKASTVGAVVDVDAVPLSPQLSGCVDQHQALSYALSGGEDYELMFTVAEANRGPLEKSLIENGVHFTKIGQISAGNELQLQQQGKAYNVSHLTFEHF
ncbi:thiamine-phosphate kinase [Shewanella marina]|uniref:thiamine-phosphate kinase n=1 Tax=Shewanella marina TaxID=487319 RepID=UPI0004717DCE|nr:thiamine-phosphate kinase [Shewanella marina]